MKYFKNSVSIFFKIHFISRKYKDSSRHPSITHIITYKAKPRVLIYPRSKTSKFDL